MASYKEIAENYYTAVGNKDVSALEKFLHQDVKLNGPLSKPEGREGVVNSVKFFITQFDKLTVERVFEDEKGAVVIYSTNFPGKGEFRSVALVGFKDGLIDKLELLFDPRPFL